MSPRRDAPLYLHANFGLHEGLHFLHLSPPRRMEPGERSQHAKRLVRSIMVVRRGPRVDWCLCGVDVDESGRGQQLFLRGLVEALDLAGRRWRANTRESVDDPVLSTDAIELALQHRELAVAVCEDLAVVGEDFFGHAMATEGLDEHPADGRGGAALSTMPTATQKREWSSTHVTTFSSVLDSRTTPATTSICHSSIGRLRSQRLKSAGRRFCVPGSMKR